jgi:hypothetical protein
MTHMDDTSSLEDHLISFQNSWNRLYTRTHSGKDRASKGLKDVTEDEIIKGAFLLASLSKSYKNIVDTFGQKTTLVFHLHISEALVNFVSINIFKGFIGS